jgi:hypothetical protein
MFRITETDVVNLISQGAKSIKLQIYLDFFNRFQLYLSGRITRGAKYLESGLLNIFEARIFCLTTVR